MDTNSFFFELMSTISAISEGKEEKCQHSLIDIFGIVNFGQFVCDFSNFKIEL